MKSVQLALCAVAIAAPPTFLSSSLQNVQPDIRAQIDSVVRAGIAGKAFSGVVLVARHDSVVYQRAAGMANRETRTPMKMNTRLQIASMTKLFTQIAIQQLEQSGKLSLLDTVGKWLPDYPNAMVRSKVTIEQLLQHRSGIGSFWNERFLATHASVRSTADFMNLFEHDSLLFEPGTGQAYSNGGYVLLGAIIERVTGQTYHTYVRQHIFDVAGMTATVPYDTRIEHTDAAVGYTTQNPLAVAAGDRRRAGSGQRPGADSASVGQPRLLIIGPDGRQLSPDAARAAVAQRDAANAKRVPNTAFEAGVSGPAGDDFSTAGDLLRLATALTTHRLLDPAHTNAVLGSRFSVGGEFRANGGGPGVNAEFSIYPTGYVIVVLSNYDPPAATSIAQSIRSLL